MDDVLANYKLGNLFPLDIKESVTFNINMMLMPVRRHFETNEKAKLLLEKVKSFKVTK
jgi:tyrosyl-tRNA synthetase